MEHHDEHAEGTYYVPAYSKLPFFTALALFLIGYGSLNLVDPTTFGIVVFMLGAIAIAGVLFAWFKETIKESKAGLHDEQMMRSYRWGMFWFLFADFMLFAIMYFGYFYAKHISLADMAGIAGYSSSVSGHYLLWPNFKYAWPLLVNPNPTAFAGSLGALNPWGFPALNMVLMLLSSVCVYFSFKKMQAHKRKLALTGLIFTLILGFLFIFSQILSMMLASSLLGLKLSSGIYGSLLFMITGLHLGHVIVAWLVLFAVTLRAIFGAFDKDMFALQAATWFWMFLTLIFVLMFLLVYL